MAVSARLVCMSAAGVALAALAAMTLRRRVHCAARELDLEIVSPASGATARRVATRTPEQQAAAAQREPQTHRQPANPGKRELQIHRKAAPDAKREQPLNPRFFAPRDASGNLAVNLRFVDTFLRWECGQALLGMNLFPNTQEITEARKPNTP